MQNGAGLQNRTPGDGFAWAGAHCWLCRTCLLLWSVLTLQWFPACFGSSLLESVPSRKGIQRQRCLKRHWQRRLKVGILNLVWKMWAEDLNYLNIKKIYIYIVESVCRHCSDGLLCSCGLLWRRWNGNVASEGSLLPVLLSALVSPSDPMELAGLSRCVQTVPPTEGPLQNGTGALTAAPHIPANRSSVTVWALFFIWLSLCQSFNLPFLFLFCFPPISPHFFTALFPVSSPCLFAVCCWWGKQEAKESLQEMCDHQSIFWWSFSACS